MSERACKKCGTVFDARYCVVCKKAIGARYYEAKKDKINAYATAWRRANPEAARAINRAGYYRNRESSMARTAAWRKANPERVLASARAWAIANADRKRATKTAWHLANPRARSLHESNRRARGAGRLSSDLPKRLFALQRGKCACCKKPLGADYHLDHILPLALGGRNEDANMQLLRGICNMQKHKKHPVDFMQQRGYLL